MPTSMIVRKGHSGFGLHARGAVRVAKAEAALFDRGTTIDFVLRLDDKEALEMTFASGRRFGTVSRVDIQLFLRTQKRKKMKDNQQTHLKATSHCARALVFGERRRLSSLVPTAIGRVLD